MTDAPATPNTGEVELVLGELERLHDRCERGIGLHSEITQDLAALDLRTHAALPEGTDAFHLYRSRMRGHTEYWEKTLNGYVSRRDCKNISRRIAVLREALVELGRVVPAKREPTGWARVDRGLDTAREKLAAAQYEEDYQGVGLLCREALISVAQAVYDPERHPATDGVSPSETDAHRILAAFIAAELADSSNEATRRHAKAALNLANDLTHKRTATFREAAMCAEAVTSTANLIAIVSGRRDIDPAKGA